MVTFKQALECSEFHWGHCKVYIGKRGGVKEEIMRWRRNGATKTWKTRPGHFSVPVKYGLKDYATITHENAADFHVSGCCEPEEIER
jgi:hypothetical protein